MRELTGHDPGTFCWPELATGDQAAAKAFYSALFGWTVEEHPMGPAGVYTIFKDGNRDVAAGEPGTLVWTELLTSNAETARDFYSKLFGWEVRLRPTKWSPLPYTVFMRGDKQAGGMTQITPEMGDTPSQWLPYFGTSDTDATTAKAQQVGGNVIVPPSDVPDVARFAILEDPQGATFGILRFAR